MMVWKVSSKGQITTGEHYTAVHEGSRMVAMIYGCNPDECEIRAKQFVNCQNDMLRRFN